MFAASVSPPANVKPTSVVSIVVPSHRSATGWTLMNPETVFVAPPSRTANASRLSIENATKSSSPPRLDLVRFLRQLHQNTGNRALHNPEHRYQMQFFQVRKQSASLCWGILKHDVPLVDTTCTDQDGDEERDVVHHELHQPQSDASCTSEDAARHVRSVIVARCQVYPGLSVFHSCWKKISLSSCSSCLCHETLQVFDLCQSINCVCSVIQLILTVTSVPVNVFFVVVIVIIFALNSLWIRVIP